MSLLRKFIASLLLISLCSCGFTPVYKQNPGDVDATDKLAAVEIIVPHNLLGQEFKTELSDLINPNSKSVEQKYRIEVKLTKDKTAIAIQQDRSVTRYKVTVRGDYKITAIDSSKVIGQGYMLREGGFDKLASDYSTYVSEDDTTQRIVKELAADAKTKLMSVVLMM
jgi:hypothetical protein